MKSNLSSPSGRVLRFLRPGNLFGSALGPFLGLVVVIVLFSIADMVNSPRIGKPVTFPTVGTAQDILKNSSMIGVAALGMTIIIIAGGIDLSAGSAMALCATVTAWFFRDGNFCPAFSISMGLLTGCVTGLFNGILISFLRIVPFIITLGTMTIYLGAGLILASDTPIRAYGKVPDWLLSLQNPDPDPQWLLVSTGVWVMAGLAIVVGALLKYSVFGRYVYAIGSNESTARLCGINVTRQRILVYTIAGFFVGVAGLYQFTNLSGEGDPNAGAGKELEVIAAVVICSVLFAA